MNAKLLPPSRDFGRLPWDSWSFTLILLFFVNIELVLAGEESKPLFASSAGHVLAMGTWRASTPGEHLTKHAIQIQCFSDIRECFEARADIVAGEPQAFLQEYRVIEWNSDGVLAEDSSSICTTARLIINFQERSVTAIDTPKKGAKGLSLANGKNACQLAEYTRTYTLVNQFDPSATVPSKGR